MIRFLTGFGIASVFILLVIISIRLPEYLEVQAAAGELRREIGEYRLSAAREAAALAIDLSTHHLNSEDVRPFRDRLVALHRGSTPNTDDYRWLLYDLVAVGFDRWAVNELRLRPGYERGSEAKRELLKRTPAALIDEVRQEIENMSSLYNNLDPETWTPSTVQEVVFMQRDFKGRREAVEEVLERMRALDNQLTE